MTKAWNSPLAWGTLGGANAAVGIADIVAHHPVIAGINIVAAGMNVTSAFRAKKKRSNTLALCR